MRRSSSTSVESSRDASQLGEVFRVDVGVAIVGQEGSEGFEAAKITDVELEQPSRPVFPRSELAPSTFWRFT